MGRREKKGEGKRKEGRSHFLLPIVLLWRSVGSVRGKGRKRRREKREKKKGKYAVGAGSAEGGEEGKEGRGKRKTTPSDYPRKGRGGKKKKR